MGQGRQIGNGLPHTCGTKHGLKPFQQEDGTVNGYCYSCGVWVKDPFGEGFDIKDLPPRKEKTPEQIKEEIDEILGYKTISVPQRKLRQDNLAHFEVKVAVSERDGVTPTAMFFPLKKDEELRGFHVKMIDPPPNYVRAYNVGKTDDIDLLGWDIAKKSGAYSLIITEGPEDMVSAYRIHEVGVDDPKWMPAVVSLPFGATSAKRFLSRHVDEIKKRFKKVILCFDDDEPGHKAVKEAMLILPEAVSVTLPYKDANECVMEGKTKEAYKSFRFNADKPTNTSLIFAPAIHMRARTPAKWGEMSWPFEKLNDLTRGIRYGETYYIGAGVKTGKSELRDEIAAGIMKDGKRVLMCSFEEAINKTYKKLTGKIASRILYDPKKEFDYDAYDAAGEVLADKLALLDIYQQATVEACQQNIVKGAEWGAKGIFIDPITNFTNGIDAANANTILQGFAQSLQQLARDLEVSIFIYCHLKEPDGNLSNEARAKYYRDGKYRGLGNCSHEYGGTVLSSQFAGSRGMMRSCNYMLGIEANKDKELPKDIRNVRDIILLEDREFGEVGSIPVYWDDETGRFTEV